MSSIQQDTEYQRYKRIHQSVHPSDDEESKVAREIGKYRKYQQVSKAAYRRLLKDSGAEAAELLDELADLETVAQRNQKNAKGHKTRLKKLQKSQDFL